MATIYDDDLLQWEAWAAAGRRGRPFPARIVFRCLSDARRRPLAVEVPEGIARAEAMVREAGPDELRAFFQEAEPIG